MIKKVELDFHGRPLSIEVGRLAKQADGAALVQYGETVVLVTAVAAKELKMETDFFPLTVDYQEKTFAAGKIPGGFFKREGRPSEKEILTCRIDRPLDSPAVCRWAALRDSSHRHGAYRPTGKTIPTSSPCWARRWRCMSRIFPLTARSPAYASAASTAAG